MDAAKQTEDEFEAEMGAISTVYALRPGVVLTEAHFQAIQAFDAASRRDQERATDAFHRGYQQGLSEGGGADVQALKNQLTARLVSLSTEKAMRSFAEKNADDLREAIKRIWEADVYEGREKAQGISLDMVDAIRRASILAGFAKLLPGESP